MLAASVDNWLDDFFTTYTLPDVAVAAEAVLDLIADVVAV